MNLRDRVALNIQDLRRARGLSQEALAHQANVSRGHMGRLENSKFAASLDLLERIAKALNVDWRAPIGWSDLIVSAWSVSGPFERCFRVRVDDSPRSCAA